MDEVTYVSVLYNGTKYYLIRQPNAQWLFTSRQPTLNGNPPVEITVTNENGEIGIIGTNDEMLIYAINVLVRESQSQRGIMMINYYPEVIKCLLEFQLLIQSTGFEIDFLKCEMNLTLDDAFLTTMGLDRIIQWEIALGILPMPEGTADDRRAVILARFRGGYKFNTEAIKSIVNAFTGGTCNSYIQDSCLYVKISPPPGNKEFRFESVEAEIARRVPAHLNYKVTRNYSTWRDIRNNFTSWEDVKNKLESWESVMLYIAPRDQ